MSDVYGPWETNHCQWTDYLEDQEMDGYSLVAWRVVYCDGQQSDIESVWRLVDDHEPSLSMPIVVQICDPVGEEKAGS